MLPCLRDDSPRDLEPSDECPHCTGEPEPGWIETPNNGPIVSCPICNAAGDIPRDGSDVKPSEEALFLRAVGLAKARGFDWRQIKPEDRADWARRVLAWEAKRTRMEETRR